MKMVGVRFWIYLRQSQQDLLIKWMWDVRCERKGGVRDDSRILGTWETERMKSPLTKMESLKGAGGGGEGSFCFGHVKLRGLLDIRWVE